MFLPKVSVDYCQLRQKSVLQGDIGDITNRELLDVKVEDSRLGLGVSGLVSNANYNVKRATFLLFINSQFFYCCSVLGQFLRFNQ